MEPYLCLSNESFSRLEFTVAKGSEFPVCNGSLVNLRPLAPWSAATSSAKAILRAIKGLTVVEPRDQINSKRSQHLNKPPALYPQSLEPKRLFLKSCFGGFFPKFININKQNTPINVQNCF